MSTANQPSCRDPLILVVDDEPIQLETICRGLHLFGYRCVGAGDAEKALALLDAWPIAILVTDLTMPTISGFELIAQVRRRQPALPLLAITGLALRPEIDDLRAHGVRVLQKPFTPDDLDQAIRETLEVRS